MTTIKQIYDQQGYVGPLEIMSKEQAFEYKNKLLEVDSKLNLMNSDYRCKSNVLFPWINEISRNPKLIEYLTEIIGSNIHCWDTLCWIKYPESDKIVSFHQDATYWNFDRPDLAATVWFAFDDVTPEHGSIEYIQGSHKAFAKRHKDVKTSNNLLMRGQTVDVDIPKERIKTSVPAGNVLIHSPFIIHGSGPNISNTPRLAIGMIYASTECKPLLNLSPESTIMVSGTDEFNYMIHDPEPTGNWDNDVKNWQVAYDRQHINYYKMEQKAKV